ncbi:hypothetical protein [Sphingomonas colocasiae]|uniref:Glycine zipper family protein n=1 Tax=Sphingomonas colocasiae TaxID=1848973 RepID=A0ABS7PIJ6_9SPHN|nr:hypothetical protein [Sphingomonas colocasiae]MBY8821127.1 hypothetical protein [Sphingomonas colocasiae]
MRSVIGACLSAALACGFAQDARAQDIAESGPAMPVAETVGATVAAGSVQAPVILADSASPFGAVALAEGEAAGITMPELAFDPTPEDQQNFDKYYYFNRPDTDFATAYADISECDGYARGLSSGIAYQQPPYPYAGTMAGAVGGLIGNAIADAIAGSAEKRRMRRVNMRKCMNFKGYERYGLSKARWQPFNFEEGLANVKDEERQRCLKQQALVASSYKPTTKGLGL